MFRSTPNAVLLATSSFWQGVDVVGEALSCVIVDKLPFASPGDPVTAARIDTINARGGDAFGDYQVPLAILALQQGLGRLIRHRTDRGVLAVLDPRLRTTGYGRRFLSAAAAGPGDPRPRCHRPFLQVSFLQRPAVDRPEPSGRAPQAGCGVPALFSQGLRRLKEMRTHLFRGVCAVAVVLALAASAFAQSVVRGKVQDAQGKPVEGATIVFEAEGTNRKMQTNTDKKGEFLQVGLQSGPYTVTATKDGVGTANVQGQRAPGPQQSTELHAGARGRRASRPPTRPRRRSCRRSRARRWRRCGPATTTRRSRSSTR